MTIQEALAWEDARTVDRWRMVRERHPQDMIPPDHEHDAGYVYSRMNEEAMATLAAEVRRRDEQTCESCHGKQKGGRPGVTMYYCAYSQPECQYVKFCGLWSKREGEQHD